MDCIVVPLRRTVWLWFGIHRAHAIYAILLPRQVPHLTLLYLYRNILPRTDAPRHGVGLPEGLCGLSEILHHRNGLLPHNIRSYSIPEDRSGIWKEEIKRFGKNR